MSEYQPGRIYSGVVNGERCHMISLDGRHFVRCRLDAQASELLTPDRVTDVRGPLVVLDLSRCDVPSVISQLVENTDDTSVAYLGKGTCA